MDNLNYIYDDGGRVESGFKGEAGDCVVRAVAIASKLPYKSVYKSLSLVNKKTSGRKSARDGINTKSKHYKDYMTSLGFKWVATMQIGSGCKVHLTPKELPKGRLVTQVSKHCVAVIDGVIRDTFDSSRDGTRCVYGYWIKQ